MPDEVTFEVGIGMEIEIEIEVEIEIEIEIEVEVEVEVEVERKKETRTEKHSKIQTFSQDAPKVQEWNPSHESFLQENHSLYMNDHISKCFYKKVSVCK